VQSKVIRIGDIALGAESFGTPDDPAVLLIMGAMGVRRGAYVSNVRARTFPRRGVSD
jgi:hypothetical protein